MERGETSLLRSSSFQENEKQKIFNFMCTYSQGEKMKYYEVSYVAEGSILVNANDENDAKVKATEWLEEDIPAEFTITEIKEEEV